VGGGGGGSVVKPPDRESLFGCRRVEYGSKLSSMSLYALVAKELLCPRRTASIQHPIIISRTFHFLLSK